MALARVRLARCRRITAVLGGSPGAGDAVSRTAAGTEATRAAGDRLGALVHRLAERLPGTAGGTPSRIIETHISYVLLAGGLAYKFKKPVDFGFVDFTTLSRRRRFCWREVELNSRFAPELYLGVVRIRGTLAEPRLGGDGRVLEYAVKMRRFDDDARGDALLERDQITLGAMMQLARDVAAVHSRAERAPQESDYGAPRLIRRQMLDNLDRLAGSDPETPDQTRYRQLGEQTSQRLDGLTEVLMARKRSGFVRDCHGDLHLTNLAGLGGRLVPFDCIEFNDALRIIDVQSDIAFLIMDLQLRGRHDLASRFLNTYLEHTGDYAGLTVLRCYLVYRSLVRAKVARLQSLGDGVPAIQRRALRERAEAHVALAEGYWARPAATTLYLMHGFSGSGKSSVSEVLADSIGAVRIRSDVERKRITGLGPLERTASRVGSGLYAPEITRATYDRLLDRADRILAADFSAIVDASFLRQNERQRFVELAMQRGVGVRILACRAALPVLRERIRRRACGAADASEATAAVLEAQLAGQEPLTPAEEAAAVDLDTGDARLLGSRLRALGVEQAEPGRGR